MIVEKGILPLVTLCRGWAPRASQRTAHTPTVRHSINGTAEWHC
jgi:hypothetical protein